MTPERYQQVKRIYHQALAVSPQDRAELLARSCAGDDELRAEVVSLLAANEELGSFLAEPAMQVAAGVLADERIQVAGRRVGHYRVISLLGAGGMGDVYLAEDVNLRRKAALKFLPAAFTADRARVQRFLREAQAASALNHPNILTIYEIGEEQGEHYIAAELVEGQTLRRVLQDNSLEVDATLDIAVQIAGALDAAHSAGIIHRDIKPENVMVRPDGLVKVLDFGLAKLTAPTSPLDSQAPTLAGGLTVPGMIVGTPRYMSPEQARGLSVDARTDIFSLGEMLYEMLSGYTPFNGETAGDLIAAILTTEPPPLDKAVPEELQSIVRRALRKDLAERYQTSREMLADLKELKHDLDSGARRLRNTGSTQLAAKTSMLSEQAIGKDARRRFTPLRALFIALAATIVVVGGWWWSRSANSDAEMIAGLRFEEIHNWKSETGEGDTDAAFSPDGKFIAFSSTKGGSSHIWLKIVGEGEPQPLTKGEGFNRNPVWSSDGRQIAYVSLEGNQAALWRIPAIGGAPVSLGTLPANSPRLRLWSKDKTKIYYEARRNLFAFDIASDQATKITNFDEINSSAQHFSLSPAEDRIAYVEGKAGQFDVWVVPIKGGAPTQLTNDTASDRFPFWHPDGERILYSSRRDRTFQICVAYLDGRQPLQLTTSENDSLMTDVSKDGTKILYGTAREESDIWGVNIDTGNELEVTSDSGVEFWPDVMPDGKKVVFQAVRGMNFGSKLARCRILVKSPEAEGQQTLLLENGLDPKWSPDGSRLAFLRLINGEYVLWIIQAIGGGERQLTSREISPFSYLHSPYNRTFVAFYSWSPDGSRIAFSSKNSAEAGIWLTSVYDSTETKVISSSESGASFQSPLWSPDGKRLAYVLQSRAKPPEQSDSYGLWQVDAETGQPTLLHETKFPLRLLGWLPAGDGLLVATVESTASQPMTSPETLLMQVSTAGGGQRTIARLASAYFSNVNIRPSPDGRLTAFVSRQDGRDNLWVISATGGPARKITTNNDPRLYFSSLTWSPDGKTIYFGKQLRLSFISMIHQFR